MVEWAPADIKLKWSLNFKLAGQGGNPSSVSVKRAQPKKRAPKSNVYAA
jgi:hypothetical protein